MQIARASHTATLLNTGKVLIAGWGNATAELFDPATGIFGPTGSMLSARVSHTATLLNTGKVLLTGGIQGAPPNTTVLAESELYDPGAGTFSQTLSSLATAREWHTASLLPDGKVLVTGGLNSAGNAIASVELFDPSSQGFTLAKGNMETARAFHTSTALKDGTVLVTGGDDGTAPLGTAEVYDPTTGVFSPTGSMGTARQSHTATLLSDGKVLVIGGANGIGALATAERYQ
jgi:WD40 repeat protein